MWSSRAGESEGGKGKKGLGKWGGGQFALSAPSQITVGSALFGQPQYKLGFPIALVRLSVTEKKL